MPKNDIVSSQPPEYAKRLYAVITILTAVVYYFSNPKPQNYYDYTFRVAANILGGSVGFTEKQPSWLNEFVPFEGFYYSVFPLGGVVTMFPFALLKVAGLINDMPGALIAALSAGVICLFLFMIGRRYEIDITRLIVMTLGVLFGTWMWTNLTMAGAWQLALGFAMIGELGAIYFTVYNRRPVIAGLFFALALGNRTEILLTAPLFFWLLLRRDAEKGRRGEGEKGRGGEGKKGRQGEGEQGSGGAVASETSLSPSPLLPFSPSPLLHFSSPPLLPFTLSPSLRVAKFCIAPLVLGIATLLYNYIRFHSVIDFGYARIPGVLNEPWYNHGIFSYHYIPRQMWEMMWRPWETRAAFPYLVPNPFSSSIFWSSPFILFALRCGAKDKILKYASWSAVLLLCVLLWLHGNSGGWQFGYRYAMVCLPWLFVILLESSPKKLTTLEWAAYALSFVANIYATWLFHWTKYLSP